MLIPQGQRKNQISDYISCPKKTNLENNLGRLSVFIHCGRTYNTKDTKPLMEGHLGSNDPRRTKEAGQEDDGGGGDRAAVRTG